MHRRRGQTQLAGRLEPRVPGEDHHVLVDDDRLAPAEFLQRGGHRRHRGRVPARVAGIGDQPLERQVDDVHGGIRDDAGGLRLMRNGPAGQAGPKRTGGPRSEMPLTPPFRFGRGSGGLRCQVLLAFRSKRNEMACFSGVTGKALRCAPQHTFPAGKDPYNQCRLAAAAAPVWRASRNRHLRKAKRPASLSAAGRNASQGHLSTMPRIKSTSAASHSSARGRAAPALRAGARAPRGSRPTRRGSRAARRPPAAASGRR
jgi:hypothetical protein